MNPLYCSLGKLCRYLAYLILVYLLMCAWRPVRAQDGLSFQGRVLSAENQEPLIGANLVLKGTSIGGTADKNGDFSLRSTENRTVLSVSFIGYRALDTLLKLPLKKPLILLLHQETSLLSEVKVSTGYWQTSKRLSTGNISKVSASQIQGQPVTNALQALQGRMPGVLVSQRSGVPGSGLDIQIRGRNSFRSAGNSPLYIIDGVPYPSAPVTTGMSSSVVPSASPLNSIDPSSIESIEVLKDADATAIYGSRGANGVVLITTKKAGAGKTTVDADLSFGVGKVTRFMDLLNTNQYLLMRKEAFRNDNIEMTPVNAPDLVLWDTTRYTNWQKELIGGISRRTNASVSVSAGGQHTSFAVKGSYLRESSVFPGSFAYRRAAVHLNLSNTSEDGMLHTTISTSYTADNNNLPTEDLITQAVQLPPNAPKVFDESGKLNWEDNTWTNPFAALLKTYKVKTCNLVGNMMLDYQILAPLRFKASIGFNRLTSEELKTEPMSASNPSSMATGRSRFGNSQVLTWMAEPQLEFSKTIGKGQLSAIVGITLQQSGQQGLYLSGTNYSNDALLEDPRSAPILSVLATTNSTYRYSAGYTRINYTHLGRYIVNLTARRDGSSRFGPDRRFANFGAMAAAWLFDQEPFMKNLGMLSTGKLRASYGSSGNDQIPDYGYLDTYASAAPYQGSSLVPVRLANPNYSWEINRKLEIGLDLGITGDRINLSASWFRNRSSSQLVGESLPAMTGFTTVQNNLPALIQNSGWEFELTTINLRSNSLRWTSSLNLTTLANKLLRYDGIEKSSLNATYQVGKSLFTTKRYHYLGVDPLTGVYTYQDVDGDGNAFGAADKQALKKVGQDYFGGLVNEISYRNWRLSFLVQFIGQNQRNYMTSAAFAQPPGRMSNQPVTVMDRWQQPGQLTSIQKFTQNLASDARIAYSEGQSGGDISVTDASFVRLQNVHVSWTLPSKLALRAKLQKCILFIQGQNLLTFTNYLGYDPETATASNIPPLKVVAAGINLTL